MTIALAAFLCACSAQRPETPASARSILASSSPSAGSTVRGEVDELKLRFDPPARLDEVIVSGPQGRMPMMIHAIGESADYSLPLSGVGSGRYTVTWRASARGTEYQGSFDFTAK